MRGDKIRFISSSMMISFKRNIISPLFYLQLIFIIIIIALFTNIHLPNAYQTDIGIILEDDAYANYIQDELYKNDYVLNYISYDDSNKLEQDVLSGTVDCGFVIKDDHIDYICSVSTTKGEVAKESIFAIYYRYIIGKELEDEATSTDMYSGNLSQVSSDLITRYNEYLDGDKLFTLNFVSTETDINMINDIDNEDIKNDRYADILSIIIFATTLLSGSILYDSSNRKLVRALTYNRKKVYEFAQMTVPSILISISASIYMMILTNNPTYIVVVMPYVIICALWSYIFSRLFRNITIYLFAICCITILTIAMTGSIYDYLSNFIPAIKILKYIFPTFYYCYMI